MTEIRPIRVKGDVAYIPLTQGYEAIIDAADVPFVQVTNWHAYVRTRRDGSIWNVYALRSAGSGRSRKAILLHRALMMAPFGTEVDHRDGNGLNNRRGNLRIATREQNARNARTSANNASGFKGVWFDKESSKWRAEIKVARKRLCLGRFADIADAAAAYARASAEMHGEFGRVA